MDYGAGYTARSGAPREACREGVCAMIPVARLIVNIYDKFSANLNTRRPHRLGNGACTYVRSTGGAGFSQSETVAGCIVSRTTPTK
jgi:hypothetical protein